MLRLKWPIRVRSISHAWLNLARRYSRIWCLEGILVSDFFETSWGLLRAYVFSGDAYTNATALVITFIVNNYEDPDKNKVAEAWEAK